MPYNRAMLTSLRIQGFKSWADTGDMRFAPITAFFGPNSSGKSSILQFLLMLKQTVESSDAGPVLNFGTGPQPLTNLGSLRNVMHNGDETGRIEWLLGWKDGRPGRGLRAFAWPCGSMTWSPREESIPEFAFPALKSSST